MDTHELRKMLEQLLSEVENAQSSDQNTQDVLRNLQTELQQILEKTEETGHPLTLRERLEESVYQLETEHPALAHTLQTIINTLSNLGV